MIEREVERLLGGCPGATGAAIVDPDGIPVVIVPDGGALEEVGARFSTILRDVEQAERELRHGSLRQFTVVTESSELVLTLIRGGYFLVVALERGGLTGKARFLARRASERLYGEFI